MKRSSKFMKRLLSVVLLVSFFSFVPNLETNPTKVVYARDVSNNRPYEWYMDQGDTGEFAGINCGPTSTAMILKWLNRNSLVTGESLRNEIPANGNWWSTVIIQNYMNRNGIFYFTHRYNQQTLVDAINAGRIALVCLNMSMIERNFNAESNIGRFYDDVTGHFIVVKGYKYIQNELYFEVYDPFSMGAEYANGIRKGQDRLYKATEFGRAVTNWWNTIYTFR